MAARLHLWLLLLAAWASTDVVRAYGPQQDLRHLTDSNFEHDTQAATGQTTGHWLVLFTKKDSPESREAEKAITHAAAQLEGQPIFAKVDVEESPVTASRFEVKKLPELRLFLDRSMVKYAGDYNNMDDILNFVRDGWKSVPAEAVPNEKTFWDQIIPKLFQLRALILQLFNRFPVALALVGAIVAMGGYLMTKRILGMKPKQRRRRPPLNVQKRMKSH